MLVHRRVTPSIKFAGTHLYTWVERGTVRVKCLAQEHNTMSLARAHTQTAWSGDERTNHEASAPPMNDGFWEFRRSLHDISFVGPGFALCSLHNIFCGRPFYRRPSGHSLTVDWSSSSCMCGVLQIMTKTLESHTLIRVTWLIQVTSSTSSSSSSSGSNFFFISLLNRNFRYAYLAASSKSMSSSSIKRRRVFMTLWCILDALSKSFVAFFYLQVIGRWKQHFWHSFGIFPYQELLDFFQVGFFEIFPDILTQQTP